MADGQDDVQQFQRHRQVQDPGSQHLLHLRRRGAHACCIQVSQDNMNYMHATCIICMQHALFACNMHYLHATCIICMQHALFACSIHYFPATCMHIERLASLLA